MCLILFEMRRFGGKMLFNTKKIIPVLSLLVILMAFTGCGGTKSDLADGTYSATEQGFGGDVTVDMTIAKGKISEVSITGDKETPGLGQAALNPLAEAIIEAQSAEVEGVSGASYTSKAVKAAAAKTLAAARGEEPEGAGDVALADGTYNAETWSFSPNFKMELQLVVKDGRFSSIEVTGGNDTKPILQSVLDLMVPRMIEAQSLSVDSITGATTSSNAVKAAAEDCLVQAIAAAGGATGDVRAFYVTPEKSTEQVRIETDILVVGMGGSGITTAVRAAEEIYAAKGNDPEAVHVLGIDKAGKYGGTSAVTSSPMSINPPSFVASNGGEDFVDVDVLKSA